jgi:predicted alpha/beta superfamily hydrolase
VPGVGFNRDPMRFTLAIASLLVVGCPAQAPSDTAPPDAEADVAPDRGVPTPDVVTPDAVVADAAMDAVAMDTSGSDAPADQALEATTDAARDVAPDVAPDVAARLTTLRVRYTPTADPVALRGSVAPLNWERGVTFRRVADDAWEWSSADLSAPLEWKPLLGDRTWSRGPNYRAMPGTTVEVFPRFNTVAGAFARTYPSVRSTVLGNTRGVWIYLPPTYDENRAARFPVVYMHDGQNLFDPRAAFGGVAWDADGAMDGGAESGAIREAILVGVENNASRIDEYTPTRDATVMGGGRGDLYLRFLVDEVKPMIDREFRTLPGRETTAIVGSSLGGLISLYAGVRRPDVFGVVGALSPSTWWDGRVILREVMSLAGRPVRPIRVYVDSGDAGTSRDGVDDTRELAATLRTLGYAEGTTLRHVVQPGGQHSERFWAMRLPGALAFMLGPREATAP